MADDKKTTKKDDDAPSGDTATSPDVVLAEKAGISEGEVKALRDNAGVNQLAGHEANIHAWSLTPEAKKFIDGEKDRNEAAQKQAEAENAEDEGAKALNEALGKAEKSKK